MVDEGAIGERFRLLSGQGVLDERGRRLWAAAGARSAGHGGSRRWSGRRGSRSPRCCAGWPTLTLTRRCRRERCAAIPGAYRSSSASRGWPGHAIPYGVYDLTADEGWVSVGIARDTAPFAVNSILSWWQHLGKARCPDAASLTLTADCGGSNSSRPRLWKTGLQRLADQTGLETVVCHFPPGTSKWKKVEHRAR